MIGSCMAVNRRNLEVFESDDEIIDKLEKLLFSLGAMNKPPCFKCGYNGPGYYQPETHPCAKLHHDLARTG